eukprot:TRINITY_DN42553_c0_g1_i1.p1 TRINITY_DN42553_c0_g1~~TRINITY_DN42553_c0_g1_i1.p1  ORF type:complete len:552 (+),score=64.53 TRINITY_DN42553_c0_g1_i1:58-1656(+)
MLNLWSALVACFLGSCVCLAVAEEALNCSASEDLYGDSSDLDGQVMLLQLGLELTPRQQKPDDILAQTADAAHTSIARQILTVTVGPKTTAALFLLWAVSFALLCLCSRNPSIEFVTSRSTSTVGIPEVDKVEPQQVGTMSLLVCYLVLFVDAFGFGIYIPFVPSLAKTFAFSAGDIATLFACFSLAQALNTPLLGFLSDIFGRRALLLLSLTGETAAYFLLASATSYRCLFVGYVLAGSFCATIGVSNAYIAEVSPEEERPVLLAYSSGSIALGLLLGLVVGTALSYSGFGIAVHTCGMLSLVNLMFVCCFLAEPRRRSQAALRKDANSSVRLPRFSKLAWPLYFGAFLGSAGVAATETCGSLFIMDSYFKGRVNAAHESTHFFAANLIMNGVIVILVSVVAFPWLMQRLRQNSTFVLGVCLRVIGYCGLALAPSKWCFIVAHVAVVVGDTLAAPNVAALLTQVVDRSDYGAALGTLSSFQASARVLYPFGFAALYDKVSHSAPYLTVAGLGVFSAACWLMVYRCHCSRQQ